MAAQPLLIVEHATPIPALDGLVVGALAAALAAPNGGRLPRVRLHGRQDIDERVASREHVAAHGALWPNGSLWLERAGDAPLPATAAAAIDDGEPIAAGIVAFNPLACRPMSRTESARAVAARCPDALWLTVRETGDGLAVADAHGAPVLPALARDAYGRIAGVPGIADAAALRARFALRVSGPAPASAPGPTVLVVGEEAIHREVYPAAFAALADAGDAVGLAPRLRIQSPRGVDAAGWRSLLDQADGVVLPGGPDMEQTRGQILAAGAAFDADVPALGLCLGMQTMATALLARAAGWAGAAMEEADPAAPRKAFQRLHDRAGHPIHRLGMRRIVVAPGSRLAAIAGTDARDERLHHRYHFNPEGIPALASVGVAVSARAAEDDRVVDAIEAPAKRFFMGLQGHPELSSRPDAPHPLVVAFLAAAARHRRVAC